MMRGSGELGSVSCEVVDTSHRYAWFVRWLVGLGDEG